MKYLPLELTCRAILTMTASTPTARHKPGSRCPDRATERGLCWVHARALDNPVRLRPLELAPLTERERA